MNLFKIVVLSTGGTIEKVYDESLGSLENRDSQLHRIISRLRLPHTEISHHSIMNKDSANMNDFDRESIRQKILHWQEYSHPIIVIHGTDTMTDSARFCEEKIQNCKVPVIFTGAMKPLGFENSDALQNVTEVFIAARLLSPGFYISFHSHVFPASKVRKNVLKGTFESCT